MKQHQKLNKYWNIIAYTNLGWEFNWKDSSSVCGSCVTEYKPVIFGVHQSLHLTNSYTRTHTYISSDWVGCSLYSSLGANFVS